AEMPDMYEENEYDLAGFAVGIADKKKLITGDNIQAHDKIIGITSSGVHSNGYSLVRKVIKGLDLTKQYEGLSRPLGDHLLEPTKIYAKAVAQVMEQYEVKGITHITGGGFYENFPRMLPEGLGVKIDSSQWDIPEIFQFLKEKAHMSLEEMYGVFNMGIGMALVVNEQDAEAIVSLLNNAGEQAMVIGEVINEEGVFFN